MFLVGPLPTLEPLSFIDKTSLVFTLCLIAHSFVIVLDTWRSWSTEVQIACINYCFKINLMAKIKKLHYTVVFILLIFFSTLNLDTYICFNY